MERKAQLWLKDKFNILEVIQEDLKPTDLLKKAGTFVDPLAHFPDRIPEENSRLEKSIEESKRKSSSGDYSLNFDNISEDSKESSRKSLDEGRFKQTFDTIFGDRSMISDRLKSEGQEPKKVINIADDPYFKAQVHKMLNMKYKYGFMKAFGGVLFTIIILLLMLCIIFNCNALSLVLFVSLALP
jgi:hypothetical protein